MQVKCKKCGAELPENSIFCGRCGNQLALHEPDEPLDLKGQQSEEEFIARSDYTHPDEKAALKYVRWFLSLGKIDEILFNWYMEFKKGDLIGREVLVSERMRPDIFNQAKGLSLLFGFKAPPSIYIQDDPYANASTSGIKEPFIIISTKLLELMKPNELLYILSHEFAHIKSEHVRYQLIAEGILTRTLDLPFISDFARLADIPIKLALLKWSRLAEHSADRAGYIISGNIGDCCSALLKLELRTENLVEHQIPVYLHQARKLDVLSWLAKLNILDETHPYGPIRLRELIRFASSDQGYMSMSTTRNSIRKAEIEL